MWAFKWIKINKKMEFEMGCNSCANVSESTGNSTESLWFIEKKETKSSSIKWQKYLQTISHFIANGDPNKWCLCVWRSPTCFLIVFQSKPKIFICNEIRWILSVKMFRIRMKTTNWWRIYEWWGEDRAFFRKPF